MSSDSESGDSSSDEYPELETTGENIETIKSEYPEILTQEPTHNVKRCFPKNQKSKARRAVFTIYVIRCLLNWYGSIPLFLRGLEDLKSLTLKENPKPQFNFEFPKDLDNLKVTRESVLKDLKIETRPKCGQLISEGRLTRNQFTLLKKHIPQLPSYKTVRRDMKQEEEKTSSETSKETIPNPSESGKNEELEINIPIMKSTIIPSDVTVSIPLPLESSETIKSENMLGPPPPNPASHIPSEIISSENILGPPPPVGALSPDISTPNNLENATESISPQNTIIGNEGNTLDKSTSPISGSKRKRSKEKPNKQPNKKQRL